MRIVFGGLLSPNIDFCIDCLTICWTKCLGSNALCIFLQTYKSLLEIGPIPSNRFNVTQVCSHTPFRLYTHIFY